MIKNVSNEYSVLSILVDYRQQSKRDNGCYDVCCYVSCSATYDSDCMVRECYNKILLYPIYCPDKL